MKLINTINVDNAVINAHTTESIKLQNAIIRAAKAGKLKTWNYYSNEGVDYLTHNSDQYLNKAFLGFTPQENRLEIKLEWLYSPNKEVEVKAMYFGMIIYSLLTHFNFQFSKIEITD